jgi:BolA family transcriptional regulator, general stress-responsive regulator
LALEALTDLPMGASDVIAQKLTVAFSPAELSVVDDSAKHAGHSGSRPEGETHFSVRVVSNAFEGLSRVERQRRVYAALADELKAHIHALSVTTLTPAEAWNEH